MAPEPEEILENQTPAPEEEVVAAPEGEQQQPEPEEKRVPLAALKEARAQKKALANELEQVKAQLAQYGHIVQQLQAQPRSVQQQAPQYDPEVKALVAPILEEYLGPLQAKLQATEAAFMQERQMRSFEQKMAYVEKNIPFLDDEDFREEFAAAIENMSQEERDAFENSPVALVKLAHAINGTKAPKSEAAKEAAKAVAKASAKGVSGVSPASKHANVGGGKNVLELSREEFNKQFKGFLD